MSLDFYPVKPINPLDIVIAPYSDFNGGTQDGLFVVAYKEALDDNDYNNKNVVAFKVTSQDIYSNKYRIPIPKAETRNLKYNSFVYANKPTSLLEKKCIYLDTLPSKYVPLFYQTVKEFFDETERQMFERIIERMN